ncbi:MAG: hypothetical protein ACREH6_05430 [Geminicoccaceae bacterium]
MLTQIWVALCVYLLLASLKFANKLDSSMQRLLRLLDLNRGCRHAWSAAVMYPASGAAGWPRALVGKRGSAPDQARELERLSALGGFGRSRFDRWCHDVA